MAGFASNARMICTPTDVAEKASLVSLIDEDRHLWNMTLYDTNCEGVPRAESHKVIPLCSEGTSCLVSWNLSNGMEFTWQVGSLQLRKEGH